MNIAVHLVLAISLFFIINWVGKHSSSFGYMQLSLVSHGDRAIGFNLLLKALAPTVYVILAATALYLLHGDKFVRGIWWVAPLYFAFRLMVNVVLGRAQLLDWVTVLIQIAVGTAAAYVAYLYVITPRKPLFPDMASIGNQMWIGIALFLYAILNNVTTSGSGSARRKNEYVSMRFADLRKQYAHLIDGKFPEKYMELVAYAVLIYETFNRPWFARVIERAVFPWGSRTLGPMQVQTERRISDQESVALGMDKLRACFQVATSHSSATSVASRAHVIYRAVAEYNKDTSYVNEVFNVLHILWARVVPEYQREFETMRSSQ